MSGVLQKTPEMHEQSRLSGQFDSCLFFIIQYFLINKGISATSDIFSVSFFFPSLFNDFVLKYFFRNTDMHEIDYTFHCLNFFVLFFSSFFSLSSSSSSSSSSSFFFFFSPFF